MLYVLGTEEEKDVLMVLAEQAGVPVRVVTEGGMEEAAPVRYIR